MDVTVHCNLVGIDKGNISRYEAQVEGMRVETAIKFAIALSCTLDQLFTYSK